MKINGIKPLTTVYQTCLTCTPLFLGIDMVGKYNAKRDT